MEILKDSRAKIDAIDEQLVTLLVERFKIVHDVGLIKASKNIPVVQSERAEAVKNRVAAMADAKGLDGTLLRAIYTLIIDHAHTLENTVADQEKT